MGQLSVFQKVWKILLCITEMIECEKFCEPYYFFKAEQAPFLQTYEGTNYFNQYANQFIMKNNLQRGQWRNNTLGNDFLGYNPPSASFYTGMASRYYVLCFVIINILHMLALMVLKSKVSKDFKKLNILDKVLHCALSTNFAYACNDWDFHKDTPLKDLYSKMIAVRLEVIWNIIINVLFNCCLLTPLVYLCK